MEALNVGEANPLGSPRYYGMSTFQIYLIHLFLTVVA